MTDNRRIEIYSEAKKRMELWLNNSSFDEMTVMGSRLRFDMALGLYGGYPFELKPWMKEEDFQGFINEDEFDSPEYESIISQLFEEASSN